MDEPTERELAPRMAITDDLTRLISEGKARIISREPDEPINGRPMVKIEVELLDD